MKLLQSKVFVVFRLTRGRSEVSAVFNKELHAQKFVEKMKIESKGTFIFQESTLYDFAPSFEVSA